MFWLARLIRLLRPMPPTPTPAMLSVSLGGVNPRPRTCLGTMAHAAPPAATLVRNVRREISFFLPMTISPGLHYRPLLEPLRSEVSGDRRGLGSHPSYCHLFSDVAKHLAARVYGATRIPPKQSGTGQKLRRKAGSNLFLL